MMRRGKCEKCAQSGEVESSSLAVEDCAIFVQKIRHEESFEFGARGSTDHNDPGSQWEHKPRAGDNSGCVQNPEITAADTQAFLECTIECGK